jgi:arylsulfatase
LWYCPGANHAPHHAPKDYIEKYKGKFDDGYEAYREWVLARMVEKGILPKGTKLTPVNPMSAGTFIDGDMVRPWKSLSAEEKKLFSRMAEVYAAFSEYTDVQIGRVIDYLEESGQLDNTLIFYCADNGASGEGSPGGSVNENRFFNGYPDDIKTTWRDRSARIAGHLQPLSDGLGGCFSRLTGCSSAIRSTRADRGSAGHPLAEGFKARGEVRHQYHHCTDIVPTILECCGLEFPDVVEGARQTPLAGVSMRYSFDEGNAPTRKETQYYEMLGTRGIWHRGGRRRPSTGRWSTRATSTRTAGSSSIRMPTARRRRISPTSIPRR